MECYIPIFGWILQHVYLQLKTVLSHLLQLDDRCVVSHLKLQQPLLYLLRQQQIKYRNWSILEPAKLYGKLYDSGQEIKKLVVGIDSSMYGK